MDAKTSEWRAGPNVCRCCLTEGCYKDISTEYFWMGKREVYAEMLSDTLSLSIAYSQSGGPNSNSRLICELCISRLRDASDFKRQVLECEKTFMQHLDASSSAIADLEVQVEPIDSDVKLEQVKQEKRLSDDDFDDRCGFDDDDDDLDDQPLTKLASKIPKKESVDLLDLLDNTKATEKRKSSTKTKSVPAKKTKSLKKEPVKASASKVAAKTEKKKKGTIEDKDMAAENTAKNSWKKKRRIKEDAANAAIIIKYSNAVVFRLHRGKFMCAYCPKLCLNVSEIRIHSVIHEKLDLFEYPAVRNSFPLRIDITDLACSLCGENTHNIDKLKTHLAEKHLQIFNPEFSDGVIPFILSAKEYRCVHCSLLFEGLRTLFTHMNEHYQSHICPSCGKGFSGRNKLRSHVVTHQFGQFKCLKCDSVFPNRAAKNRHLAITHGRKDRYRCPICDEHFTHYRLRRRHLHKAHGPESGK